MQKENHIGASHDTERFCGRQSEGTAERSLLGPQIILFRTITRMHLADVVLSSTSETLICMSHGRRTAQALMLQGV